MKVLILQLARFGDILCTWPSIRAYRAKYPNAEIHLLVRERFQAAASLIAEVDKVICLPTASILSPLPDVVASLANMSQFVEALRANNYTNIFNLTFSPFSSYLTNSVRSEQSSVVGYHRFPDGHLAIPDDTSAYFYAQVGIGKSNRYHLTDVFAGMMNVELAEADWSPEIPVGKTTEDTPYFVLHLGASQPDKVYPVERWKNVLDDVLKVWNGSVVLIGSPEECQLGVDLESRFGERIRNLIGKTEFLDLFSVVANAAAVVGADSAPMHIAGLVGTPAVNLSFATVNMWETAPKSPGSRILYSDLPQEMSEPKIAREIARLLKDEISLEADCYVDHKRQLISLRERRSPDTWKLIQFLYAGGELPEIENPVAVKLIGQMREVNELALEQLFNLQRNISDSLSQSLLARVDELFHVFEDASVETGIIMRWFNTERVRIGPATYRTVLEKTFKCHKLLDDVLLVLTGGHLEQNEVSDGNANLEA